MVSKNRNLTVDCGCPVDSDDCVCVVGNIKEADVEDAVTRIRATLNMPALTRKEKAEIRAQEFHDDEAYNREDIQASENWGHNEE
jgi:hypothetical protein